MTTEINQVAELPERIAVSRPSAPMRVERATLGVLFIALFVLRIAYAFRLRLDSDETQHLHVVWGWANGLLPYRDLFDNHMSLFQLLCAPVYWVVGPRPDVVPWMRLAMIPIYALTLWSVYRIGVRIFSRRVGMWAALFTGVFPYFFFKSEEFRPDDLWTAFWTLAIALLVAGKLNWRRSFIAGFALGLAAAVSLKTTMLLISLGCGAIAALLAGLTVARLRQFLLCSAALLAGFAIPPATVAIAFASAGLWQPFYYCNVQHNVVLDMRPWEQSVPLFFCGILLALWASWKISKAAPSVSIGARRVVVFFSAAMYLLMLCSFWLTLHRQHFLPFYPLALTLATGVMVAGLERLDRRVPGFVRWAAMPASLAAIAVAQLGVLEWSRPLQANETREQAELLKEVQRLTEPQDFVMDKKGETIFRRRPYYYVLETMTNERIARGLLADEIPEAMIRTRTCAAITSIQNFPPRARQFLAENFLPVGRLRVSGKFLSRDADVGGCEFQIEIPATYQFVSETGPGVSSGVLDGKPCAGTVFLEAGRHSYRRTAGGGRLAVVWSRALERGFSPFQTTIPFR